MWPSHKTSASVVLSWFARKKFSVISGPTEFFSKKFNKQEQGGLNMTKKRAGGVVASPEGTMGIKLEQERKKKGPLRFKGKSEHHEKISKLIVFFR